MDLELDQRRAWLIAAHSAKRKEARKARRLQRRCRVKNHEDLDELVARYDLQEILQVLPDPADRPEVLPPLPGAPLPSKDFFANLAQRQFNSAATVQSARERRSPDKGSPAPRSLRRKSP